MGRKLVSYLITLLLLTEGPPVVSAHGHGSHNGTEGDRAGSPTMSVVVNTATAAAAAMPASIEALSYFTYSRHSSLVLAHIILMTVTWFFILPIGVVLNLCRSRLAVFSQLSFLGLNAIALVFGILYQSKVPDLYEHNVHNRFGWGLMCIVIAQTVMIVLRYVGGSTMDKAQDWNSRKSYQPVTSEAIERHQERLPRQPGDYRYSHDSGHGTEPVSRSSQSSSPLRSSDEDPFRKIEREHDGDIDFVELAENQTLITSGDAPEASGILTRVKARFSKRTIGAMEIISDGIDRMMLVLGFIGISTGVVAYTGIFKGNHVFNGLAHFIKGGIFFWYGLLTLARWMGCFSEFGWAWNVRPTPAMVGRRKAKVPSAEFVESAVIFLYGSTNVFLEHLASWGGAWTAQDLEHVSISVMFFGGGLCGILVESKTMRRLLNAATERINNGIYDHDERWIAPKSYPFSLNPFPALTILLLGTMMSSHHQASMLSTMVHRQWGSLFVGFSVARGITYLLTYLLPPTSYLPSRPPTELITSFCLISGGIVFMASNKDTIAAMEKYGLDAMFIFTVTMGFTAFLMAWTMLVFAVKGSFSQKMTARLGVWDRPSTQA